ncbi:GSCFA domain-containing protein [Candidatus Kaiserbacteria bacterium]|nr:GSCFA domain-containing protein [Candidatus Kaiserbacteria bacterium]
MVSEESTLVKFKRRMRRISENQIIKLKEYQFFQPPELLRAEHLLGSSIPLLDRTTPIGSMGSCFAREIKSYLETHGYNYVHYGEGKRANHGSAPWERVFNTGCILQEVERAMCGISGKGYVEGDDGRIYDLCRKGAAFESTSEAALEEEEYIVCGERAFLDSDIFTLGMSETWYDKTSGITLAEAPPGPAYKPECHKFRLLSPEENIKNIKQTLGHLFFRKPKIKVILTVSPVPLRATFFARSAAVSNNVSKGALIYAAHSICQEFDNVYYFPSYEITQYLADTPFEWDGRHVTEPTINLIMSLFMQVFEKPSEYF